MERSLIIEEGVRKRVLYAGRGELADHARGTKIAFHYLTKLQDEDGTVLDDSKKQGKTMEIIIGKKFKFEVWEKCLKSMRLNEVAEFATSLKHCASYPAIAKTLREYQTGTHDHLSHSTCCAGSMMQSAEGLGHEDLNSLMKEPKPLTFILEVVSIIKPEDYDKELWQIGENEQVEAVARWKEDGNALFALKNYEEAAKKYGEALTLLDNSALREKPQSPEWQELENRKIPLLLNFCQCHLLMGNYRLVIEHATSVLQNDKDNVKALYRRGKAFAMTWELDRARSDLTRVAELDPTLNDLVTKNLSSFEKRLRDKEIEEKKAWSGKLL